MSSQNVTFVSNKLKIRPVVSSEQIEKITDKCFGLVLNPQYAPVELDSFADKNFVVSGQLKSHGFNNTTYTHQQSGKFVLKIYNASQTKLKEWYNNINCNLLELLPKCKPYLMLPHPIHPLNGNETDCHNLVAEFEIPLLNNCLFEGCTPDQLLNDGHLIDNNGKLAAKHLVRLTTFLPGHTLKENEMNKKLLYSWGESVARLTLEMKKLSLPKADLRKRWFRNVMSFVDLTNDPYLNSIEDAKQRSLFNSIIENFQQQVLPKLLEIADEVQWTHGDMFHLNILTTEDCMQMIGFIDFDDSLISHRIADLSCALLDILEGKNPVFNAAQFYKGYSSLIELHEFEVDVLYDVMMVYFVRLVANIQYEHKTTGGNNTYVSELLEKAWNSYKYLMLGREKLFKQLGII